jgi:hypothetical protein
MPKQPWVWFLIGVVFALFVLPIIQQYFANRKTT